MWPIWCTQARVCAKRVIGPRVHGLEDRAGTELQRRVAGMDGVWACACRRCAVCWTRTGGRGGARAGRATSRAARRRAPATSWCKRGARRAVRAARSRGAHWAAWRAPRARTRTRAEWTPSRRTCWSARRLRAQFTAEQFTASLAEHIAHELWTKVSCLHCTE